NQDLSECQRPALAPPKILNKHSVFSSMTLRFVENVTELDRHPDENQDLSECQRPALAPPKILDKHYVFSSMTLRFVENVRG
ncbi:hypothetical protein, partial [Vibrio breoganii]|uniref:hypothetical protein n=2 Tax=Vibrio breoganii TaxID=553239 RepID=UPI001A7E1A9B